MPPKNPWLKFYPRDWRSDERLRIVSLAARGLWIEMMCLMHTSEPYGHLAVNGQPVTDVQLASLAGTDLTTTRQLITELEMAGVFSRARNGTIYSRRMTRDEKRRKDGKKASETGAIEGSRRHAQDIETKQQNLPPPGVVEGVVDPPPGGSEARVQKPDKKKEKNSKKEKRGTRVPDDWKPDHAAQAFARERGWDNDKIALEGEKFLNYWLARAGSAGIKLDWSATWRSWVLNNYGTKAAPAAPSSADTNTVNPDEARQHMDMINSLTPEQLEQRKQAALERVGHD